MVSIKILQQEAAAEEAAAEEAPAQEAPTEEAPTEEGPTEQAPTEEGPTEQAPAEEAPTEEGPTEEAPTKEGPSATVIDAEASIYDRENVEHSGGQISFLRTSVPVVEAVNKEKQALLSFFLNCLMDRINAYGLVEVKVSGDGNCQITGVSQTCALREIVKQVLISVPLRIGEWGDHVTLQAAADKV
ncbi:hypothetical protein J5N97_014465 [Dioscorea zingiberensis]|uniref:Uncharacterized protein n=1 Tax=Dioscorea zingiberensis TaxID=325984 RepID=A0A9D5HJR1_9LILI|nr:hypothetical protein J5N97_014465 [Dioscorea zingiberensis]